MNLQILIGSCNNIVIDDNFLENMDSSKIEELGPSMGDHKLNIEQNKYSKNILKVFMS